MPMLYRFWVVLLLLFFEKYAAKPLLMPLSGKGWKAIALSDGESYFLDATVPGSMYMDLLNNKKISDPYSRFNDINLQKFSLTSWNYTRQFTVNENLLRSTNIDLIFDGVDTYSYVYVNGRLVGRTYDQFISYRFPVKDVLQATNTILLVFESPVLQAIQLSKSYPYTVPPECPPPVQWGQCHVNFLRKEQASFSWDWGPSFPTVGIWKDVGISFYDDPLIMTDFSVEVTSTLDGDWEVTVEAFLSGSSAQVPYEMVVVLVGTGINNTLTIPSERAASWSISRNIIVPAKLVKLWWPNGYGDQELYTLNVSVHDKNPNWRSRKIGFRTIQLIQDPIKGSKGLSFYFKVNGEPIFMKGSNWIPADSFQSRVTENKLKNLLGSAQQAHMNMLRVWGGGIYEQEEFYDLADQMGILIWQDMMFACAMYPTDKGFLSNVTEEVTQQVRRLKHHPSLALWAGNNENEAALSQNWYKTKDNFDMYKNDYITLYIDTVKTAVQREHPSGIFLSSSPSNGVQSEKDGWVAKNVYDTHYGDVHYYNYNPGRYFTDDYPRSRFLSEYGYQSWPSFDLLKPLTFEEDWYEFSHFAVTRNHHGQGQDQMNAQIRYYFNPPNATLDKDKAQNFTDYIYLTQINQAMYISMVSEFARRSQGHLYGNEGFTMGALYWQLNDIWPGPSWSSIEYDGSWKMLHYYAKNFFAPTSLSIAIESRNLTVYSMMDREGNLNYGTVKIECHSWDSLTPKSSISGLVKPAPGVVSMLLFNENLSTVLKQLNCTETRRYFLVALLDSTVTASFPLSPYKSAIGLRKPDIQVSVEPLLPDTTTAPFMVKLKTDSVALFVWLKTSVKGVFSDNGFLLFKSTKTVTFTPDTVGLVKLEEFMETLTVKSLMDLYAI